MVFSREVLRIDAASEALRIVRELQRVVRRVLRRQGAVVGISGGVDSAVVLALAVSAFGPDRVIAVMMPDCDSEPISEKLARELAAQFKVRPIREEVTAALEGLGCYARRDRAVRRLIPDYDAAAGYRLKITLPPHLIDEGSLNVFSLTVEAPDGRAVSQPLPAAEFLQIVAASNFKQRTRMAMLYYHAESRNYAVLGTANRNEHDQGFFVKHGDSGVDVLTIGHLYKTQVYQLAEYLEIPDAIRKRPPTSDTYSAPCDQQEFFFRVPFELMDLLHYALEHGVPAIEAARVVNASEEQVQRVYDDLRRKSRSTEPLRLPPIAIPPRNEAAGRRAADRNEERREGEGL